MEYIVGIGIVLLLIGFVLIGIEMAVPGFGAPGISGIACLIGGIICTADSIEEGLTITIIVVVILAVMMTVAMTLFKRSKAPVVLDTSLHAEESYIDVRDLEYLVGKVGIALTDLRPIGKCDVEGVEFDVKAQSGYISCGSRVQIVRIQEQRIVVRAL